jgi:adenosine kinase
MTTLICGSVAYDTIMVFHDRFKNYILPEQIHILNVAFLVPDMRREFGGCAGNIAYNLKLLGAEAMVMATVGTDSKAYLDRLETLGISRKYLREIPDTYTAQAFITNDLDDNQITAFHPGAMNFSHHNRVADADGIELGIVSPDGREGMVQHCQEFHAAGIPFIFDPGQGLPMFSGEELTAFLDLADYCTVNDYEGKLLCERTGLALDQLARKVKALIITRGGEGSTILAGGDQIEIRAVPPQEIVDPTGCGDAYRAGLLFGIARGLDWRQTGQLASLMGSIKIACRGGQNHTPSRDEIGDRYLEAFGTSLW